MISIVFSLYRLYKENRSISPAEVKKKKALSSFILVSLPLLRDSFFNVLTHRLVLCTVSALYLWYLSSLICHLPQSFLGRHSLTCLCYTNSFVTSAVGLTELTHSSPSSQDSKFQSSSSLFVISVITLWVIKPSLREDIPLENTFFFWTRL